MIFTETPLRGAFVVDLELRVDSRGFFARWFCANEFETHGLKPLVVQGNLSFNHRAGTLRGMHMQVAPSPETKLVRCTMGAIYDVIVDVRPDSPTYLQSFGIELSAENHRMLYVPEFFAHGYLTLTDNAEVSYLVGEFYNKDAERGLRYNDPALNIQWPHEIAVISEKDANWPLLQAEGSAR